MRSNATLQTTTTRMLPYTCLFSLHLAVAAGEAPTFVGATLLQRRRHHYKLGWHKHMRHPKSTQITSHSPRCLHLGLQSAIHIQHGVHNVVIVIHFSYGPDDQGPALYGTVVVIAVAVVTDHRETCSTGGTKVGFQANSLLHAHNNTARGKLSSLCLYFALLSFALSSIILLHCHL
jgi:hypothetical protein